MIHRSDIFLFQAIYCGDMTAARELWTEILQKNNGNKANVWMEYLRLER